MIDRTTASGHVQMGDEDDLQGKTVAHVWVGGLRCGSMVILCTDGTFLAFEAVNDDDDAYIHVHLPAHSLDHYVDPRDLLRAGVISQEAFDALDATERKARAESAAVRVARAKDDLERAERELKALKPVEPNG